MSTETKSRRGFLGITAMGVAGAVVAPHLSRRTETRSNSKWGIKLGVASYSLREFTAPMPLK
jgi:uncharacterized membrane protein YeaQ/YmgE (transglycosylase-associated protein family)